MANMEVSVQNKSRHTGERGVALIIALLAMTVIAGLGMSLLVSSSTESLINGSFRRAGVAHYNAMGGLEELRGRMGPDARPIGTDLTSVRIPCSTPATCPPLFNPSSAASGGVPARSSDLTQGYYIRISSTIDPTNSGCTYQGVSCYDDDPNRPTSPVFFTTSQPGTAMPYVWVKVQVATQRRLKRNLATPCNTIDPLDMNYCDPATLDNLQMVCWTGIELRIAEDTNGTDDIATLPDPTVCGDPVNPLLIYTSLSIQPGGTLRVVRELAALGKTPTLPGGLVLDGCPAVYPPPTSNQYTVSGIDTAPAGDDTHAVTTRCEPDMWTIQSGPDPFGIDDEPNCMPESFIYQGCQDGPNRNPNYPGISNNGCSPAPVCNAPESADIFYDASLSDPNANPLLATCGGLQSLVQYIRNIAYTSGYVYPAGTTSIPTPGSGNPTNDPTVWNRVINVITGDATLSQADFGNPGAGIILIEGTLDLTGYPAYNGLILIIGEGVVNISGAGNGVVNGGILVANTSTCINPTDPPGPIAFNAAGGGNFTLNYNSDAINPLNGTLPVQKLSLNY